MSPLRRALEMVCAASGGHAAPLWSTHLAAHGHVSSSRSEDSDAARGAARAGWTTTTRTPRWPWRPSWPRTAGRSASSRNGTASNGATPGWRPAASSPRRTAPCSTPAGAPTSSNASSQKPVSRPSASTTYGTAPRRSCSPPEWTPGRLRDPRSQRHPHHPRHLPDHPRRPRPRRRRSRRPTRPPVPWPTPPPGRPRSVSRLTVGSCVHAAPVGPRLSHRRVRTPVVWSCRTCSTARSGAVPPRMRIPASMFLVAPEAVRLALVIRSVVRSAAASLA